MKITYSSLISIQGLPQSLNQDILLKSEGFFDRLRSEMKTFQEYIGIVKAKGLLLY